MMRQSSTKKKFQQVSIGSNMEEDSIIDQTETNSRVGNQESMSHVSSNSSRSKRSSMQTRSMRANSEKKQKAQFPYLLKIISPILSHLIRFQNCFIILLVFWIESTLEVRFTQSQWSWHKVHQQTKILVRWYGLKSSCIGWLSFSF